MQHGLGLHGQTVTARWTHFLCTIGVQLDLNMGDNFAEFLETAHKTLMTFIEEIEKIWKIYHHWDHFPWTALLGRHYA